MLLTQVKRLVNKLLTIKVIGAGVATILLFKQIIDPWMWLVIFGGALGLREVSKVIYNKGKK